MDNFKERLREYLDIKGITQKELSKIIGDSQQAISDFLKNDSKPQRKTREKYFDKLLGFKKFISSETSEKQASLSESKIEYPTPKDEIIELQKFKIATLEKELKECREELFFKNERVPRDA